jgi:hypothetical protein
MGIDTASKRTGKRHFLPFAALQHDEPLGVFSCGFGRVHAIKYF